MSNPDPDGGSQNLKDRLSSIETGNDVDDGSSGDAAAPNTGSNTSEGGIDETLPGIPGQLTQPVDDGNGFSSSSLPPWEQPSTSSTSTSTSSTSISSTTSTTSSSTSETTHASPTSAKNNPVSNGNSDDLITFNSTNWRGEERHSNRYLHIFEIDDGKQKFGWAIKDKKVELTKISLLGHDETKEKQTDFDIMNRVIFQGKPVQVTDRRRADRGGSTEVVTILSDGGGIEINMEAFGTGNITNYRAKQMAVMLDWKHDGEEGFTRSAAFTVYDPDSKTDEGWIADFEGLLEQDKNADLLQALESTTFPDAAAKTSGADAESTGGAVNDDDGGGSGGGSSGLSTGAIAGISVAAGIVFLAIVGGLIFFCLRRRRRRSKRSHDGYDNPSADSGAYLASNDKELHHVTESPQSTSSHEQQAALAGASRNLPREHSPRRSEAAEYSSYHDDGSGIGQARNTDTPQGGVPSSVAHLVEDGMTPDEIRRLEEEERQLDDAIERRARR